MAVLGCLNFRELFYNIMLVYVTKLTLFIMFNGKKFITLKRFLFSFTYSVDFRETQKNNKISKLCLFVLGMHTIFSLSFSLICFPAAHLKAKNPLRKHHVRVRIAPNDQKKRQKKHDKKITFCPVQVYTIVR